MIDLRLLEQLIAFNDYGTLSNAAEKLLISQPALTRSMQRLEEELGVQLFIRTKNKMTLTETGYYTVSQARQLLKHSEVFKTNIHHFASQQTVLYVGASAPGPIYEVEERLNFLIEQERLICNLDSEEQLLKDLMAGTYQLVITRTPLNITHDNMYKDTIISQPFFIEELFLSVPDTHPLSKKEVIEASDLDGLTMLLRSRKRLGIWCEFVDNLKNTHFIEQVDDKAFDELINASNLPSFASTISNLYFINIPHRVILPINMPNASIPFYVNSLKKHRHFLDKIISLEDPAKRLKNFEHPEQELRPDSSFKTIK
ncbi:MAG: LysR family transcriptional regulator [Veillonella sp.]|uniref:LysR family transcriptional regulator n=1 Tax=Veillonella sp. TaxID=1926307 RepID=UPI0025CF0744|nr:LysR family transcriptional regulator [Veillonella sp.]MBS4912863.1 LysR family transcriptional regulator [Veillonella sp.]